MYEWDISNKIYISDIKLFWNLVASNARLFAI